MGSFFFPATAILIISWTSWTKHSPTPEDQQVVTLAFVLPITVTLLTIFWTRPTILLDWFKNLIFKTILLSVHVDPHTHLNFLSFDDSTPDPSFLYHNIVGSLQFACIETRHDFSYAVNLAAKYYTNPSPAHCNALRRILKYLVGTLSFSTSFSQNGHALSLTVYTDADFAMDLDNRRSRSRFILFVYHSLVLWATRKQANCASSTTKYLVASSTTKEIIWHKRLLSSLVSRYLRSIFSQSHNPFFCLNSRSTGRYLH